MRERRLFTDQALSTGETIVLKDKTAHYLLQVLRQKVGDTITLFNGQGGSFSAEIKAAHKKQAEVVIGQFDTQDHMPSQQFNLAVGVIKQDKMDFLIQKATELGVSQIQPLLTTYTDIKLQGERLLKKQHHWQQVAISACEQANRNRVPAIMLPCSFNQWLDQLETPCLGFHPYSKVDFNRNKIQQQPEITFAFGPEGGFSETEVNAAIQQGVEFVHLGSRILRAETAPVAVLAAVQLG
jgi:16S rRNA (uracil1498-N3)-methyltransferase